MKQYLQSTRAPWCSYLFVLPLLALYQGVALLANLGERRAVINGADALVQQFLGLLGLHGWLGSWLVVAVVAGILVYRADPEGRKQPFQPRHFGLVLGESAVYATFFGSIVSFLTSLILPGAGFLQIGGGHSLHLGQRLATSLGAGLYEELVFRLLLTGGLLWAFRRCGWSHTAVLAAAVVTSSVIFSGFHYVGSLGEVFQLGSFMFRFVAGLVLAGLFAARGFAVAAWTHALYDVFLVLMGRA